MAEITSELISSARSWLRIATQSRDEEIEQVLEACSIDLSMAGVKHIDFEDAGIQQAMKLYLKSQFGYDSKAEQFANAYEHLKKALALCGDYNSEVENGANS